MLKSVVVFNKQDRLPEEKVESNVVSLTLATALTKEQGKVSVSKDSRLSDLAKREPKWSLSRMRDGVHRGIEVPSLQYTHSFLGELSLREHHHSVAIEARLAAMNAHSLFCALKHRIKESSIGRRKLRAGVIISVEAQGKVVDVFP